MSLQERQYRPIIRQKVADALEAPLPVFTERIIRLPDIPGKAMVVIGMCRSGKTTFLWQCLASKMNAGAPRRAPLLAPAKGGQMVFFATRVERKCL